MFIFFFFFNDTATTEISPLSLHDALPISCSLSACGCGSALTICATSTPVKGGAAAPSASSSIPAMVRREPSSGAGHGTFTRSEEHTSELQSQSNLVCRLLLEKKKQHSHRLHNARETLCYLCTN